MLLLAAVSSFGMSISHAADPQSYAVTLASTGNDVLDATLKESSQLESLRVTAPVGPFALIGRAQQDVDRLQTVLQSFGYYQGGVSISIDGLPLDDPGLAAAIEALPKETAAAVAISVDTGPLYHLRNADHRGRHSRRGSAAASELRPATLRSPRTC